MKEELLRTTPENMEHAKKLFKEWQWEYNELRPHYALGMKTPGSVYTASNRTYAEPKPYEYDAGARLIKVNNWGYLKFGPIQLYLSETMKDTYLEIRPDEEDTFLVIYRNFVVVKINAAERKLINRHIWKL